MITRQRRRKQPIIPYDPNSQVDVCINRVKVGGLRERVYCNMHSPPVSYGVINSLFFYLFFFICKGAVSLCPNIEQEIPAGFPQLINRTIYCTGSSHELC